VHVELGFNEGSTTMTAILKQIVLISCLLLLAGCAARQYHPAPLIPADTASGLESRSLSDAGLQAYEEKNAGHPIASWPQKTWSLGELSLAAFYFSPTLDSARERVAEAQAAVTTAGARPNPTLSVAPGVPSPYLMNVDFSIPIETAGKRGHRVQGARSLEQAAQLDLADSAWKIRSGVRSAMLNYLLASRNLELLRSEEKLREEQVTILEQRLSVGEIPRPELDLARIELSKTHLAINAAEGQLSESRAALAGAIGVPVSGLEGFDFAWPDLDSPPGAESLSLKEIQRDAVLNRLDVRRALAEYSAAEAGLQLEISRQYPDIEIGPGYVYEERNNFFTLALSAVLPLFNKNLGPIAEAEARRKQAAAAFIATQAQVIADGERALAVYTAALKELNEADQSLHKLQDSQVQMMQQAVRLGEEDHLALNGVQIESSALARTRLDTLARAQNALGQLEDAVQRPLDPGDTFAVAPESPALNKPFREPKP